MAILAKTLLLYISKDIRFIDKCLHHCFTLMDPLFPLAPTTIQFWNQVSEPLERFHIMNPAFCIQWLSQSVQVKLQLGKQIDYVANNKKRDA